MRKFDVYQTMFVGTVDIPDEDVDNSNLVESVMLYADLNDIVLEELDPIDTDVVERTC